MPLFIQTPSALYLLADSGFHVSDIVTSSALKPSLIRPKIDVIAQIGGAEISIWFGEGELVLQVALAPLFGQRKLIFEILG